MKNILVVNVNWLGDAVFSTPVFKALKDNFPHARVTCLCAPRVKSVLEHCPFIDEIIIIDEKRRHFWPWDKWTLLQELRQRRFDAAFILHRSSTRGLITYLAGIPIRVGYCKTSAWLTHPVKFNDEGIHRSDVYLNVLRAWGLKITDSTSQLRLKEEEVESLNLFLEEKGINAQEKFIVLHTSGNWELKRWPASYFAALIESLTAKYPYKIILSGAHADLEYCRALNEQTGYKAVVVAGETSLGQSLALYKRAIVVVSSDSGPLHLAHSVGANIIGLYGPTRPEITGPKGTGEAYLFFREIACNKTPCYYLACSNNVCMQSIAVQDVTQAIEKFIS